jgi:hypothetical protein
MNAKLLPALFLAAAALVGTGASSAMAQAPPRPVIDAALRHLITQQTARGARPLIAVDRFPEPDEVRRIAERLGVRAGPSTELVECDDEAKRCRLLAEGDKLIRFYVAHRVGDQWALQFIVSTQVESPGRGPRLFFQSRGLVIGRTNGAWRVNSDQLMAQS